MSPIKVFDNGRQRAELLVLLYHYLRNRRRRAVRSDWAATFKTLMHWPQKTPIQRVDGERCLLVLREPKDISEDAFSAESLAELLRAATVGIVSAVDRYVHEVMLKHIVRSIKRASPNSPVLRKLRIPVLDVKRAVEHARKRRGKGGKIRPRPMNVVKRGIQTVLHEEFTCQSPDEIADALAMIGVKNLWKACGSHLSETPEAVRRRLNGIVHRRNLIVHEGDIERRLRGRQVRLRAILEPTVRSDIEWMARLVTAIDKVVSAQVK